MEIRYPILDENQHNLKLSVNASVYATEKAIELSRSIRKLETDLCFPKIATSLVHTSHLVERVLLSEEELLTKVERIVDRRCENAERQQKELNLCVFGAFDEVVEAWRLERGMDNGRGGESGIVDGRFMVVDRWGRRGEGILYDLMEVMGGTIKKGEALVTRFPIPERGHAQISGPGRNEMWKKHASTLKDRLRFRVVDTAIQTAPSMPEPTISMEEPTLATNGNVSSINEDTEASDSEISNSAISPFSEVNQTTPTTSSESLITPDPPQFIPLSSLAFQPTTSIAEPNEPIPNEATPKSSPSANTTESTQTLPLSPPTTTTAPELPPTDPAPPSLLVITPTTLPIRIYILNTYEAYVKAYRKAHNDEDPPFNIRYDRTHERHFEMKLTSETRAEDWSARKADRRKRREASDVHVEKEDRKGAMWLG